MSNSQSWTPPPKPSRVAARTRGRSFETKRKTSTLKASELRSALKESSQLITQARFAASGPSPKVRKSRKHVREFIATAQRQPPLSTRGSKETVGSGSLTRSQTSAGESQSTSGRTRPRTGGSSSRSRPGTSGTGSTRGGRGATSSRPGTAQPRWSIGSVDFPGAVGSVTPSDGWSNSSAGSHTSNAQRRKQKAKAKLSKKMKNTVSAIALRKRHTSKGRAAARLAAVAALAAARAAEPESICNGCDEGCLFCRGSGEVIDGVREKWGQQPAHGKNLDRSPRSGRRSPNLSPTAAAAVRDAALMSEANLPRSLDIPTTGLLLAEVPTYKSQCAEGTSISFGSSISLRSLEGLFLGADKYKLPAHASHFDKNFIFKVFSADKPSDFRVIHFKEHVFFVTPDLKYALASVFDTALAAADRQRLVEAEEPTSEAALSHHESADFAHATQGIRLGLIPVRDGDLVGLKKRLNAIWRFVIPSPDEEEAKAKESVATETNKANTGSADSEKPQTAARGNDSDSSNHDGEMGLESTDADTGGTRGSRGDARERFMALQKRRGGGSQLLHAHKGPPPVIVRHGDHVCLEQGWFRLEELPRNVVQESSHAANSSAAVRTCLRHLRLGTKDPVTTSERSNWEVHLRDAIRLSKARPQDNHNSPAMDQLKASRRNRHSTKVYQLANEFPNARKVAREEKITEARARRMKKLDPHNNTMAAIAAMEAHEEGRDVLVIQHSQEQAGSGPESDDGTSNFSDRLLHSSDGRIPLHTPRLEGGFFDGFQPEPDSSFQGRIEPRHKTPGINSERRSSRGALKPAARSSQGRFTAGRMPTMVEVATMLIEKKYTGSSVSKKKQRRFVKAALKIQKIWRRHQMTYWKKRLCYVDSTIKQQIKVQTDFVRSSMKEAPTAEAKALVREIDRAWNAHGHRTARNPANKDRQEYIYALSPAAHRRSVEHSAEIHRPSTATSRLNDFKKPVSVQYLNKFDKARISQQQQQQQQNRQSHQGLRPGLQAHKGENDKQTAYLQQRAQSASALRGRPTVTRPQSSGRPRGRHGVKRRVHQQRQAGQHRGLTADKSRENPSQIMFEATLLTADEWAEVKETQSAVGYDPVIVDTRQALGAPTRNDNPSRTEKSSWLSRSLNAAKQAAQTTRGF